MPTVCQCFRRGIAIGQKLQATPRFSTMSEYPAITYVRIEDATRSVL